MSRTSIGQAAQFVREGDYRVDFMLRGPLSDLLDSVDLVMASEPTGHQDLAQAALILARVILGDTW